ncbi:hypothetical protein L596_019681 [Steinernema carpocapsae]|uniref:Uncharacterized protein n=1 Tax=Steinernema carpocapsae TaxID=34508 RepID=A0A4U5MRC0_STECR|nr:hypothetical protein L596_019681 [Steinernema carpocapsae]
MLGGQYVHVDNTTYWEYMDLVVYSNCKAGSFIDYLLDRIRPEHVSCVILVPYTGIWKKKPCIANLFRCQIKPRQSPTSSQNCPGNSFLSKTEPRKCLYLVTFARF